MNLIKNKDLMDQMEEEKNKALAADRAKTEFLAHMSHELRTPLNAIIGFSELIKNGKITDLEKIIEYTTDIYDSGQHLLLLINDILDLSKVEAGAVELNKEIRSIEPIINSCVKLVQGKARNKNNKIKVHVNSNLMVFADVLRLKQIILNLLTNSIKFTENGCINVECYSDKEYTYICVIDNGIGMDAEGMKQALEPFGQVNDKTVHQEGTGLGLPLTKDLVELHGGELILASALGKGTTIMIKLPNGD